MWTYWCGEKGKLNERDLLNRKIEDKIEYLETLVACENILFVVNKDGTADFKNKKSKTILWLNIYDVNLINKLEPDFLKMKCEDAVFALRKIITE